MWDVVNAQGVSVGGIYPYQTKDEAVASAAGYTKESMNPRSSKPYRAVPWFPLPITTEEVIDRARSRGEKLTGIELRLLAALDAAKTCGGWPP